MVDVFYRKFSASLLFSWHFVSCPLLQSWCFESNSWFTSSRTACVCFCVWTFFSFSLPVNVYTVSFCSIPIQIMYLAFLLVFCFSLRTFCRSILKSLFHPIPAHCFPLSHSLQNGSVYDHDTFKLSTYVTYSCYDGMGWGNRCNTALIRHIYSHHLYLYGINAHCTGTGTDAYTHTHKWHCKNGKFAQKNIIYFYYVFIFVVLYLTGICA